MSLTFTEAAAIIGPPPIPSCNHRWATEVERDGAYFDAERTNGPENAEGWVPDDLVFCLHCGLKASELPR